MATKAWTTILDAQHDVADLMGSEATEQIAKAVTIELRRRGTIDHDGHDLVADLSTVDLWAVAAELGL